MTDFTIGLALVAAGCTMWGMGVGAWAEAVRRGASRWRWAVSPCGLAIAVGGVILMEGVM